ncbi:uncharacterized protein LOC123309067 [Coccinella septempunctata]|uniref:uncharacterized protein LOC123309067 n=1 Tax=Coccinella septempunctata TaxID=41139 RepID=UPI001D06D6BD|nr:uncharacterized protein LOC123309067 [Coccinella septempunctata]
MRPGGRKVPSIVVIQERHVRHGENFKIFKVSCKSRREYISKFMSSRRVTYRCKSRKVRMGCMLKETTYKGSPLAISRLLLLEGLDKVFPTFEDLKSTNDNAKSSPSLSFFNLSDKRSDLGGSSAQLHYSLKGLVGPPPSSAQQMLDLTIEKKCSPESLPDFNLIFGSDTNDAEDFDSDDDDHEKMAVEVVIDSAPASSQQTDFTEEIHDHHNSSNIIVSLARMEKDLKQIVNAFEASRSRILPDLPNDEQLVDMAPNGHMPKNQDPKPSLSVPPIPLAMKRSLAGQQSLRCFGDILQPSIPPIQPGNNPSMNRPHLQAPSGSSPHIFNINRNLGGGGGQLPFRNLSSSRALCGIVEPSGSIPFFRVPGGCFMVIHATNQTTPFLHATFVTGCTNSLQFQQTQLPVYGSHQVVAIHLGPYRLNKEEIHGVFAFACGTKVYAPCTAGRYK